MDLKDLFSRNRKSSSNCVRWSADSGGVNLIFDDQIFKNIETIATEDHYLGLQYIHLKMLQEKGFANRNSNGYSIDSLSFCQLDDVFYSLFDLPEAFTGRFNISVAGNTGKSSFCIDSSVTLADGFQIKNPQLRGPLLKTANDEYFRLTQAEYHALNALKRHQMLDANERTEYENNWLVFQLQTAKQAGMDIDLAHFKNLDFVSPDSIGLTVTELANGDLELVPSFGSSEERNEVIRRLGQFDSTQDSLIFRVGQKMVLLDQSRLEAANEILSNTRIPKDQVKTFFESPSAYLNSAMIDLDTGFSLRVHGAERFTHRYFGDVEKAGIDWFSQIEKLIEPAANLVSSIQSEDDLSEVEELIQNAQRNGADTVEFDERCFETPTQEETEDIVTNAVARIKNNDFDRSDDSSEDEAEEVLEQAVVAIDSNDETIDFANDTRVTGLQITNELFEDANLKRTPFPHQKEGIQWFLSHLTAMSVAKKPSGALLADDMGLGKTYMTLVAAGEWYRRCQQSSTDEKPILIVAPLSLLENWQAEVAETFHKSPFEDIVILQANADLKKFRISGAKSELKQSFKDQDIIQDADEIRYSLKIGKHFGIDRLDKPRRLVLTTYQTLRDYQFSLSRVDWCIAAFDEAQNLKNPNSLASRAAKGLKADFKLLATGTPVENSLKDFWSLLDTAVPGLLGSWRDFRADYISPILKADEDDKLTEKVASGQRLRAAVGDYMLRRTKATHLTGLPKKSVFSGDHTSSLDQYMPQLSAAMSGVQLQEYDEILERVRTADKAERRKLTLASLQALRLVSIHHDLEGFQSLANNTKQVYKRALVSSKFEAMLDILKAIKKRDEKVIIFATSRMVQATVSVIISSVFKMIPDVINGDTDAVGSKSDSRTRKGIIDQFQNAPGFNIIIMSPVAAGVGLTVTGANNVIHLERHWNPAKEMQATDRVYRIGQKRDVNIYIPMAIHPGRTSFDLHLNSLLSNKIDLSEAVVADGDISREDLEVGIFN